MLAVKIRNSYSILHMHECIDSLGNATILLTLNANSSSWKVEVADEDFDKTIFSSHHGLLRFI